MNRALVFDHEPYDDPLNAAIALSQADPATRAWVARGIAEDVLWNGERRDVGGDQIRLDQDAAGPFVIFAGRRVGAVVDGSVVRLGYPDRLGACLAYSLLACTRLLREHPEATDVTFVMGRSYGLAQQAWAEWRDPAGRWMVTDLTLDDSEPFERQAYYAALHATVGTRIAVPDLQTLDALRDLVEENYTLRGSRAAFLSRLSAAVSRRKGVNHHGRSSTDVDGGGRSSGGGCRRGRGRRGNVGQERR
jgi:uncharacterized membrane protein YgcG